MVFGRKNKVYIELEASELTDQQVRLLKSINTMMEHVLTTDEESEFFEASAEAMRMCASLIKLSHFAGELELEGVPYADQALEYSMDVLNEHMTNSKIVHYDN